MIIEDCCCCVLSQISSLVLSADDIILIRRRLPLPSVPSQKVCNVYVLGMYFLTLGVFLLILYHTLSFFCFDSYRIFPFIMFIIIIITFIHC